MRDVDDAFRRIKDFDPSSIPTEAKDLGPAERATSQNNCSNARWTSDGSTEGGDLLLGREYLHDVSRHGNAENALPSLHGVRESHLEGSGLDLVFQ